MGDTASFFTVVRVWGQRGLASGPRRRAGGGRRAAPARATHVRKQREVQVPPQVAHSAPAPVLEHVQVHLPLVLRGGGAYSPYSGPSPRPPPPAAPACAAHLLPPRGSLVGEVKGGRPSRPPRKQRVPVPTFGLQERNRPGSKLRAEGGAGLTTTRRASCPRTPHRSPGRPHPRPRSPPAPPHGSRWSPLSSAWTAQPGRLRRLSHWSASRHLWVARGV